MTRKITLFKKTMCWVFERNNVLLQLKTMQVLDSPPPFGKWKIGNEGWFKKFWATLAVRNSFPLLSSVALLLQTSADLCMSWRVVISFWAFMKNGANLNFKLAHILETYVRQPRNSHSDFNPVLRESELRTFITKHKGFTMSHCFSAMRFPTTWERKFLKYNGVLFYKNIQNPWLIIYYRHECSFEIGAFNYNYFLCLLYRGVPNTEFLRITL